MKTFEIKEDEIDVKEIMRKIKGDIKARREFDERKAMDLGPSRHEGKQEDPMLGLKIHKDLEYLNSNWNIQNNSYCISSHRDIVGNILVKGRELVHGEVSRYVDPIIWKQREFNACIARLLNETAKSIDQAQANISAQIEDKLSRTQVKLSAEIGMQVKTVIAAMNEDIENRAWLASILEERMNAAKDTLLEPYGSQSQTSAINYFVFEERFRGSRADIKGRQSAFLKYFEGCKNVLDIGCGRGEFLELLQENEIGAYGIDIDRCMVDYCRSRGLNVDQIDAISYLDKVNDNSLDGIFLDQVIEHLDPSYLIKLLSICYSKLMHGYYIVMESVNPLSLFSFMNFYIDMSHKQPIHPETIKFLMKSVCFRELEVKFSSPISDEAKLKKINLNAGASERENILAMTYNYNIDVLNNLLYGPQDYAIIGKK